LPNCITRARTRSFDARRQIDWGTAKGEPVRAVANGLVTWKQDIGADGWVITIEHLLADGSKVWSAYWHVAEPAVSFGQIAHRGDDRAHCRSAFPESAPAGTSGNGAVITRLTTAC
jgi:hypothetical protein